MLPLEILPVIAAALLLAASATATHLRARRVRLRMSVLSQRQAAPAPQRAARLTGPLLALGQVLAGRGQSAERLAQSLNLAGWRGENAPAGFTLLRLLLCLSVMVLASVAKPLDDSMLDPVLGAAAGFLLPGLILKRLGDARARRLRAQLPIAIDLMAMVLESGAAVEQTVRFAAVLEPHPAPEIRLALAGLVRDLDRGAPYEVSLLRFADRLAIEEGRLLVEVLRQSMLHGTEVLEPLKALAAELRQRRIFDARNAIGRATAQMAVIMIACLLPALIGLIGAPAVDSVLTVLGGVR